MSANEKNTKYRFMVEALKLFAEKGYEAVSVAQIAQAVGCSAPALYKHYKSKQELFDAILEESEKGFEAQMKKEQVAIADDPEAINALLDITEEQEIERVQTLIRYAIHNEFSQAFRKLCSVEQFHMPKLADIYTYRYVTFQYEQYEILFSRMIEAGKMREGDPKALAKMYMSLPIITIGICDRDPDREQECMDMIESHVREFNRYYRIR